MINRPEYLDNLIRWKDSDDMIKVITGVRRCGKSTLFQLFQEYLKKNGVSDKQIININLEMADNAPLLNWQKLHDYIEKHTAKGKMNYVFLDEIQMVEEYQRAVNSLRLKKNIDLYITGSNAYMFSQKLTTLLSGRYIEIKMLPLSFKEYMSAFPDLDENSYEKKFNDYLSYGSFPQIIDFYKEDNKLDAHAWHNYLDSLYNTIIVKDIMARQGIQELSKLNRVIKFMFDNIGSETSLNNISNVLNNDLKLNPKESKIHVQTIEKYIDGLLDGYIFYKVLPNYLKGKSRLRSNAKYYAVDAGLRYFLLGGNSAQDAGHILENIVCLELKRRGYSVETGKVGDMEVDFVAKLPGGKIEYYQVAQSIQSEETLARELKPLQSLKDSYPKYILSRDYNNGNYNGIQHINVLNWLMDKE
ncbi:MAG: ATP-binding protein [Elusimicrobiota bacterium]|jgi:predicted AAA+ superfamily ATPase|nr:ATP-binding protein [Elusimicrobiota bacterium]